MAGKRKIEIPAISPVVGIKKGIYWFFDEVLYLFRVIFSSADRFYWENGFSKAAALAYTSLLSLVPFTALVFGILGSFVNSIEDVEGARTFVLRQFLPSILYNDTVIDYLKQFSDTLANLNILVFAALVFTVYILLNSIEYALNEVWQVFEARAISYRVVTYCAIMVIAPALVVSGYYFTTLRQEQLLIQFGMAQHSQAIIKHLVPFLIDFAAFVCIYYLVPKAPVRFRPAVFGAFIAAALFGLAKTTFAIYIERYTTYNQVYNTLATIPIFLVWLYFAWTVVLFGAECAYQAQYLPRRGELWKRSLLSVGDAVLVLGIQSLATICRAFMEGSKLPNDLELAEKLGCSTVVLKPTLSMLEQAGIISHGDTRDMPLTLMKSPSQIKLSEIQEIFSKGTISLNHPEEISKMFNYMSSDKGPEEITLADILTKSD